MSILQQSGPSVYDSKQLLEQARQRSQGLPGHITPDTPPNSTNTAVTGGSGSMPAAGDGSSSTADSSRSGAADHSPSRVQQQQQQQQHNTSATDADVAQAVKCMTTDDMLVSWKQFLKDLSRELMNLQIEAAAAQASATATTAADCAAAGAGAQLQPAEAVGGPLAAVGHGQHFGSATPAAQHLSALVQKNSTLMKLACALNPGEQELGTELPPQLASARPTLKSLQVQTEFCVRETLAAHVLVQGLTIACKLPVHVRHHNVSSDSLYRCLLQAFWPSHRH